MQITLIRTGGIIPVTKKADTHVNWSEEEVKEVRSCLEIKSEDGMLRDNTSYTLSYNDESFAVDLNRLPAKYKKTFDDLKDHLKIVKPS